MSRKLSEDYKVIQLQASAALTTTTTSSAVNIELYDDDALAIVNLGTFTSNPTITVTITGATTIGGTYNTIGTFTAATATGTAAIPVNLTGLVGVKSVVTFAGGTSPSVPSTVLLMVKPFAKSSTNNSATLA